MKFVTKVIKMNIDQILTRRDLLEFEERLISRLKEEIQSKGEKQKFMRTKDVCEMLGISASTLQNLRINGTIPFMKIGGTLFYDQEEIKKTVLYHAKKFNNNFPKS